MCKCTINCTPIIYKGRLMKDYTHIKNPFAKPLLYKNDRKFHINWIRLLETLVTGIIITFLLFIGARFGVFEKTVVLQDTMKDDILELRKGRDVNAQHIQEILIIISSVDTTVKRNTVIIEGILKDLKDVRMRQMDYYLRNQVERKEDLKPLIKKGE